MFKLAESSSPISLHIVNFLSFGIFLFVCGFFLFPSGSAQKTAYYLTVVLPFLMLMPWLRWRKPSTAEFLVVCFIGYLVVATFWSSMFNVMGLLYFVKCALLILILIWSLSLCAESELLRRRMIPGFIVSGVVVGIYSLIMFGVDTGWKFDQVLKPFWHFANQNRMAKVFGVLALMVSLILLGSRSLALFWFYMSVLVVSLIVVLLSRSSGALLALLVSVPCYLLVSWSLAKEYRKLLYLCFIGCLCLFGVAGFVMLGEFDGVYFEQGWSYRDEIWLSVLNDVVKTPWFGTGASRELVVLGEEGRIYSHEHNIFIAVLRQSGIVGLVLLLTLLVSLFQIAVKSDNREMSLWLLVLIFGLVALSSSGEYPLERPKESWLFFWLPIALLLAGAKQSRITNVARS